MEDNGVHSREYYILKGKLDVYKTEITGLKEQNKKLVEWLTEDGVHDVSCPKGRGHTDKCNCGLYDLLKNTPSETPDKLFSSDKEMKEYEALKNSTSSKIEFVPRETPDKDTNPNENPIQKAIHYFQGGTGESRMQTKTMDDVVAILKSFETPDNAKLLELIEEYGKACEIIAFEDALGEDNSVDSDDFLDKIKGLLK